MKSVLHTGIPLEEALTSRSAITRSLARMSTSKAMEEVTKMINAELNRPDVRPIQFLEALAEWMIMTHASVAGQVCPAEFGNAAAGCMVAQVNSLYAEHFKRVSKTDFRKELGLDLPH